VAISPEKPDDTLSTIEKNSLDFEVLSDTDQKVRRAFGLVHRFTEELISIYKQFGQDIPTRNGSVEWTLPIPATYIIGRNGRIIYANYRDRTEPEEALGFLTGASIAV
jgi:peroxiredoxin